MATKPAFKTTLEKTLQSYRTGNHATVYDVRRDPELKNKNVLRDKKKPVFPFVSGSVYRGEWDNDQKCGFGTQTNPSGSKYDGEFAANKYHGVGTLWVKRGKKSVKEYVGDWANGKKQGYGTFYYENGEIYKGYWEHNKRSGKGQLDYPNGDCFVGEWENDAQKGYGTLLLHNGNVFEGLFRDGMKDGPGRFYYAATKKVYEGEWVDDEPRCGVYRAPNPEEEIKFREPSIVRESFNLPELGLKNSQSVVDMAKSETRVMNATMKGMTGEATMTADVAPFQEHAVHRAKEVFSTISDRYGGAVILMLLGPVFAELLGFELAHDDLMDLCNQLEIDPHTPISFPDIVNIAVFIRGNDEGDQDFHK